ncbi:P-loop containing nucleoside triphosphate hydrolase protein [Tribonema minus]|uniref:Kinesin-like protein n=1 Tax=Tribonema minus TaxID=303371 RepID=A0A835YLR0_9STRA|nr:P-loop containing nucleoside triphosphate hydrolase protein [Tribonema minus]
MSNPVENIRVAIRCRGFNEKERKAGDKCIFSVENEGVCLVNPENPTDVHRFGFDHVFGPEAQQHELWDQVGKPALDKAFAGFNTTIFAYGQTGSGKTFSMQGVQGGADGELAGIIPRMNEALFARVGAETAANPDIHFLVTCSYFEIYNEVVYDLLDPDNRKNKGAGLEIREHTVLGIYVKGLQEMVVDTPKKLQALIDQGMASRTVGSTAMNDTSSRSHSVLSVKLHQRDASDAARSTFAKLNLVDLAGSERQKSTGAAGARLREGANINKSLSALGNVINALVEVAKGRKVFVPYRNSKLTRVLQESLGGNSLTAMLAAVSPAACNFAETLSTLQYASRAKAIQLRAVKNEEASQVCMHMMK